MGDTVYCGTDIPATMESTGHALFIKFKTDFHMSAKGFQIEVEAGSYIHHFIPLTVQIIL